jgi:hypothetical protein
MVAFAFNFVLPLLGVAGAILGLVFAWTDFVEKTLT